MSSDWSIKFIPGCSAQRSNSFFTIFWQKTYPFVYLLLPSNGTRFTYVTREDSWPTSLELCIPLNCCKCTVFIDLWKNHKTKPFWGTFSRVVKCICLSFFSLFTDRSDRLPYSFTYFNYKILLLFFQPEAWKRYPFRAESPGKGKYRNIVSTPRQMILSVH